MQTKRSLLTRRLLAGVAHNAGERRGWPTRATALAGLLLLLAVAAGSPVLAQPDEGPTVAPYDLTGPIVTPPVDQIIIQFRDTADPARLATHAETQLLDRLSAAAGVELTIARPMSGDAYVLQLPAPVAEAEAARISRELMAQPDVVYAEPNSIMQLVGWPAQGDGPLAANQSPDDSAYADQWHYRYTPGSEEGLNLPAAWDLATGETTTVVAVIDTGIRPHGDLSGRILNGYDFITYEFSANDGNGRDADASDPGDWVTFPDCSVSTPPRNSTWHGTHVAGTIAANSDNGGDVAGVNWGAKILPVRVLGKCGGTVEDIANGIRWAAGLPVPGVPNNPNPADVINLSLGGSGPCGETYQNAFNELAALDVVAVVAAGNSNANAANFRPANCEQVITVAATTRAGNRSWYSNYGSVVEISAPGGDTRFIAGDGILSTLNAGLQSPGADNLAYYQGTSMAAPHVAGLASLLKGERPDLTADQVLTIIETTARDFPDGSNCNGSICGAGLADAFAALSALDVTLAAPALLAPADNATLSDTPALDWAAVPDALSYQFQLATDNSFATVVADVSGLTDTDYTPGLVLADDTYWWRVRAVAAENGPWSDVWRFTINSAECLEPAAPSLLAPPNGGTVNDLAPLFTWEAAANATDYEFRLGEETDVSDALIVGLPVAPQFTPEDPLVAGATYYWKVRARNLAGDCDLVSDWSVIRSVTIDEGAEPPVEMIFLPLALQIPFVEPPAPLANGDFEQGVVGWAEHSARGWRLILNSGEVEDLPTHSGIWAVWLGGDHDEIAYVIQQVTVPVDQPFLAYYFGIISEDACGFDFGGVIVDDTVVDEYTLCGANSMTEYARRIVNLSAYAGQSVALQLRIETDEDLVSSVFVDDVGFVSSAAAAAGDEPAQALPAVVGPARPAATAGTATATGPRLFTDEG